MHLSRKTQIADSKGDQIFTKVLNKYPDFEDVFLSKLVAELSKHIRINNYAIQLVDDWQPQYGSIHRLEPVELQILKTYNKNNLANGFIRLSKSFAGAHILFDKKLDKNLRLCIYYWGVNNLIIKNWYPILLVKKSLDWQDRAWRFI